MTTAHRHDDGPPVTDAQPRRFHGRTLRASSSTDTAASTALVVADHTGPTHPDHATTPRSARRCGTAWTVLLTALAVVAIAASGFWLTGGRWFSVATPSMGTTAPVGTLIATRPVDVADLHIGDVIAFVPPTEPDVTYTHRIIAVDDAGTPAATVTTRGDINGATDPWALTQHDIVGRTVLIAPGVGYLLRALPLWLLGGLVIWALTRFWLRPGWWLPLRTVGAAVLYLLAAMTIRPFLGVVQLVTTTDTDGTAHISTVSTGLLPIRLAATPGHGIAAPVDLTYGQTGMVDLHPTPGASGGSYEVAAHLHLPPWGWIAIIAFWCLPTLLALGAARRAQQLDDQRVASAPNADEKMERLASAQDVAV